MSYPYTTNAKLTSSYLPGTSTLANSNLTATPSPLVTGLGFNQFTVPTTAVAPVIAPGFGYAYNGHLVAENQNLVAVNH